MSLMTEKIMAEIELLPKDEQAFIAGRILDNLNEQDSAFDPEVEAAWEKEIARRIEEIDSGKAELIPWEEVRKQLWNNQRASR